MRFHNQTITFMNSIVKFIFICSVVCIIEGCDSAVVKNSAEVRFDVSEIDFGKLTFDSDATCSFKFTNKGNTSLIIQHVKTTCGCTVPRWPKKPVKPGGVGKIEIKFDTSHPGIFYKTITVFYNGKDSPQTLTIKGSVKYPAKDVITL